MLAACRLAGDRVPGPALADKPAATTTTVQPTITPAPTLTRPAATTTATAPPPATDTPAPSPTVAARPPDDLALRDPGLFVYPAAPVYAGDAVTFQVLSRVPDEVQAGSVPVQITLNGTPLVQDRLNSGNLGGDAVGLYAWAWTATEGTHELTVQLDAEDIIQIGDEDPANNALTTTLTVLPATELPPVLANAVWVTTENNCCQVHVVSNTAAHRDLSQLLPLVDQAVFQASERLDEAPNRTLNVYLIDRVIGQGGYATGTTMVVSYLDRDYAGRGLYEVIVHEAVHAIDAQFAPQRIPFLAEGVAMWATGGHYKQEPIQARASALLRLGRTVPLRQLIDDFYPVQHEIGYLQAASVVQYLVDHHGWDRVREFYAGATADGETTSSAAIDTGLRRHFGLSLEQLESEWLAFLTTLPPDELVSQDLDLTLRYYETMRRYQQVYDPTAFFLTAWLPSPPQAVERGITADLTRHPRSEANVALETMLGAADEALRAGNYGRATILLDSVARVLDLGGLFVDPLASNYLAITRAVAQNGFEAQRIDLRGNQAIVFAVTSQSARLEQFRLALQDATWTFTR